MIAFPIVAVLLLVAYLVNTMGAQAEASATGIPEIPLGPLSTNVPTTVSDIFGGILGNKLSASEIATVAQNAGFSGDDLVTAVAIALAESGGNPSAYNPETAAGTPKGQGSYGLWQIYRKAHPEFATWDLNDPQTNANAAFSVYSAAGGFSPWSTWNNGAYVAKLDDAQSAVSA